MVEPRSGAAPIGGSPPAEFSLNQCGVLPHRNGGVGYRTAISTHLLPRSPDSLPNKLYPSASPGSSLAPLRRSRTGGGSPPPVLRPQSPFSAAPPQPEPIPQPGKAPSRSGERSAWMPSPRGSDGRSPLAWPGAPIAEASGGRCRRARGPGVGARSRSCSRAALTWSGAERSGAAAFVWRPRAEPRAAHSGP